MSEPNNRKEKTILANAWLLSRLGSLDWDKYIQQGFLTFDKESGVVSFNCSTGVRHPTEIEYEFARKMKDFNHVVFDDAGNPLSIRYSYRDYVAEVEGKIDLSSPALTKLLTGKLVERVLHTCNLNPKDLTHDFPLVREQSHNSDLIAAKIKSTLEEAIAEAITPQAAGEHAKTPRARKGQGV